MPPDDRSERLRGAPYAWAAFSDRVTGIALTGKREQTRRLLRAFEVVTGIELDGPAAPERLFVTDFSHGGMSSGHVHLPTWRDRPIPLLLERAGRPTRTSDPHLHVREPLPPKRAWDSGAMTAELPDPAVDIAGDPAVAAAGEAIDRLTRLQQNFPAPGVLFRDLTPLFADANALRALGSGLAALGGPADVYAGLEARGFVLGTAVAIVADRGVIAVRKAGKLPGAVLGEDYALEYGTARIEVHPDDVPTGARVVIVDDVLATGGTAAAAIRLLERAGAAVTAVVVAIELTDLGGRSRLPEHVAVQSLRRY